MSTFQLPVSIHTHLIQHHGVTIYYPSISLPHNPSVQESINNQILQLVHQLMQEQQKYQSGTITEVTGHYEIKTNERGILSLTLSNYTYSTPMAHGMTILKSITFDTSTGKAYSLDELFKPNSNYLTVLTNKVKEQIKARNITLISDLQSISPHQDYYLADKSIVLYFQLYQITPYYYGFPMFPISLYDLQNVSTESGPISTLTIDTV